MARFRQRQPPAGAAERSLSDSASAGARSLTTAVAPKSALASPTSSVDAASIVIDTLPIGRGLGFGGSGMASLPFICVEKALSDRGTSIGGPPGDLRE